MTAEGKEEHWLVREGVILHTEMGNLSSHQPLFPSVSKIVERIQNSGVDYRRHGADEPLVTKAELVGLNDEERRQLMEILKDDLQRKEQRRFKWSNNPEKKFLRLCCSRQGSPTRSSTLPERRSKRSMRCRCPARVSCTESNLIFNLIHVEECLPDDASEHFLRAPSPLSNTHVFTEVADMSANVELTPQLRLKKLMREAVDKLANHPEFMLDVVESLEELVRRFDERQEFDGRHNQFPVPKRQKRSE